MSTPIEAIQQLIADGQTERALKKLVQTTKGRYYWRFLNLSNRLKRLERQNTNGTIDQDKYSAAFNKINLDLVRTLQQYEGRLSGESTATSVGRVMGGLVVFVVGFFSSAEFLEP